MSTSLPDFKRPAVSVAWLVATALGTILVAASLLKAKQWVSDPTAESDLPPVLAVRLAAVVFELALGFWLISGLRPRTAWSVAALTFTALLALTIRDALEGKAFCACFGSLPTQPWLVAAFDIASIVCLVYLYPKELHVRRSVSVIAVFLFFLAGIPATVLMLKTDRYQLHAIPDTVDAGATAPGSASRAEFVLHNDGDRQIEIATLETSCHCLAVHLPTRSLSPGQQVQGEIIFSPPSGSGAQRLSMSVRGYDYDGRALFALTVNASCP